MTKGIQIHEERGPPSRLQGAGGTKLWRCARRRPRRARSLRPHRRVQARVHAAARWMLATVRSLPSLFQERGGPSRIDRLLATPLAQRQHLVVREHEPRRRGRGPPVEVAGYRRLGQRRRQPAVWLPRPRLLLGRKTRARFATGRRDGGGAQAPEATAPGRGAICPDLADLVEALAARDPIASPPPLARATRPSSSRCSSSRTCASASRSSASGAASERPPGARP